MEQLVCVLYITSYRYLIIIVCAHPIVTLSSLFVHVLSLPYHHCLCTSYRYLTIIVFFSLICDADKRLGRNGIDDFKCHRFFEGINWDTLRSQKPPYIPEFTSDADTRNFEPYEPDDDSGGKHVSIYNTFVHCTRTCMRLMYMYMYAINVHVHVCD